MALLGSEVVNTPLFGVVLWDLAIVCFRMIIAQDIQTTITNIIKESLVIHS